MWDSNPNSVSGATVLPQPRPDYQSISNTDPEVAFDGIRETKLAPLDTRLDQPGGEVGIITLVVELRHGLHTASVEGFKFLKGLY